MKPRELLAGLYRAAIAGVEPEMLVRRYLASAGGDFSGCRRVGVFAAGKAALAMAQGVPARISRERLIVVPNGSEARRRTVGVVLRAAHPEPDRSSVVAARAALEFFESFDRSDRILALISGGASSLLCLPSGGLTLPEKKRRLRRAERDGWPIDRLNALRTRLSRVKGGRLADATSAGVLTLVISDVPGHDFRIVGSGPTISSRKRRDRSRCLAENRSGLEAAARMARERGLRVRIERGALAGQALEAGRRFARRLKKLSRSGCPGVLLAGGETTVELGKLAGRGGRNLEFALAAALELEGVSGVTLLSAGSDGVDGNSGFAGAFADGRTIPAARAAGLDPSRHLHNHDSASFFNAAGGAFRPGPTGTNVADWVFGVFGIG